MSRLRVLEVYYCTLFCNLQADKIVAYKKYRRRFNSAYSGILENSSRKHAYMISILLNPDIFHISAQNIDCEYSALPRRF